MQAAQTKVRHTPFGDCYEHVPVRANPFDVKAYEDAELRRAPRLSAAELAWVQPQLARLDIAPDMLFSSPLPADGAEFVGVYHAALQLSWNLARLALTAVHGTHLGLSATLAGRRTRH